VDLLSREKLLEIRRRCRIEIDMNTSRRRTVFDDANSAHQLQAVTWKIQAPKPKKHVALDRQPGKPRRIKPNTSISNTKKAISLH